MTTVSPLSHFGDEKAGNVSFFRRIQLQYDSGIVRVPVVTGNSLRGKLRRIAAARMCDALSVSSLHKKLYHFLFSGGTIEKGDTKTSHDIGGLRELRSDIPFVGLFGGAWQAEILPGSLMVGMIWPSCQETKAIVDLPSAVTCDQIVEQVYYSRRDDYNGSRYYTKDDTPCDDSSQMIYESEAIIPGIKLRGSIAVRNATPLEFGCLIDALNAWQDSPYLGGMNSKGHGKVHVDHIEFRNGNGLLNIDEYANAYQRNLDEQRSQMTTRLESMGAKF